MAAGLGFKDFVTGEVLTAADVDGYLMQGIWVFASAAARDAAVTSPQEGNACYLKDTNQVLTYSGSAWVAVGGGSPLTTKGDIYGFSTVDARIPIGANDTVLTADSTQALGLKWAAPAGGSTFVGAKATGNSNQSIPNNTFTAITWNTDLIDTNSIHDTSTNSERFTVPSGKAGKWFISSRCTFAGDNGGERRLAIYKNAATTLTDFRTSAEGTTGQSLTVNSIYDLIVGDYLQIMAYQDTGGALNIDREISDCSFYYLGA